MDTPFKSKGSNLERVFREGKCRSGLLAHISFREKLIVGLLSIEGIYLGWCLGGYPLKSFYVFSGLSLLAFLTLFIPMKSESEGVRRNLRGLIRYPIFWLGILFLAYVLVQGLNPAWVYVLGEKEWWLKSVAHIEWLPSSVNAPFEKMNAFRVMMVFGNALMLLCVIWLGVRSRHSLRIFLWVFSINMVLFSSVGILQVALGVRKILGVYKPATNFFGSFAYRNHGSIYLYLGLAVLLGLLLYYYRREQQGVDRSGKYFFCVSMIFLVLSGFIFSASRGGVLGAVAVLVFFGVMLMKYLSDIHSSKKVLFCMLTIIVTVVVVGLVFIDEKYIHRMESRFEGENLIEKIGDQRRVLLLEATYEMFMDKPIFGWGAGSFQHYFPAYRTRYPYLDKEEGAGRRLHYLSAHTDWLQYLAEYGVVGCSVIAAVFLYWIGMCVRYLKGMNGMSFMIYAGCLVLLMHSMVEFIFESHSLEVTEAE